MGTEQ